MIKSKVYFLFAAFTFITLDLADFVQQVLVNFFFYRDYILTLQRKQFTSFKESSNWDLTHKSLGIGNCNWILPYFFPGCIWKECE